MDLPDDTTWTWEQAREIGSEVASKAGVDFGAALLFTGDMFQAFLRQNGKDLFTADGIGFEPADAAAWFDLMTSFQKAGAIGSPSQIIEESTKTLDQGALATGNAGMQIFWSNQVEAVNAASGKEMKILRFPSVAGRATERKAWYKASMLWSASARTKSPEAAVQLINWYVNSPQSADINLAERGIPANTEVLAEVTPKLSEAQQAVAKFISDIEPELAGTPVAPLPGGGTWGAVMLRHETDVMFGKSSTADAAQKFVDEVSSNLTV